MGVGMVLKNYPISVCMATYNGEKYIREQIESILCQLTEEDELIVADDGSTDQTLAIIQAFQQEGAPIHVLQNQRVGVIKNFESALNAAQNDYLFLSDQDDVWFPEKKEKMLAAFARDQQALLIMSDLVVVDEQRTVLAPSYQELRKCRTGFFHNILRNSYIGCGLAFKRELLEKALPFPATIPMHDMWLGILADWTKQARLLPEPYVCYRRHNSNVSSIQSQRNWRQRILWRGNLCIELLKRVTKKS